MDEIEYWRQATRKEWFGHLNRLRENYRNAQGDKPRYESKIKIRIPGRGVVEI